MGQLLFLHLLGPACPRFWFSVERLSCCPGFVSFESVSFSSLFLACFCMCFYSSVAYLAVSLLPRWSPALFSPLVPDLTTPRGGAAQSSASRRLGRT